MRMKDLLNTLRQDRPDALTLLEAMVNFDTPSSDKQLLDEFARFLGPRFEAIGGQVAYVQNPRHGDHLLARFEGRDPSRLLVLGHMDTVFSAGEAARRPFAIE
jgi:glutamate carboxypeptidase